MRLQISELIEEEQKFYIKKGSASDILSGLFCSLKLRTSMVTIPYSEAT